MGNLHASGYPNENGVLYRLTHGHVVRHAYSDDDADGRTNTDKNSDSHPLADSDPRLTADVDSQRQARMPAADASPY
jgi:hypothetical protein